MNSCLLIHLFFKRTSSALVRLCEHAGYLRGLGGGGVLDAYVRKQFSIAIAPIIIGISYIFVDSVNA